MVSAIGTPTLKLDLNFSNEVKVKCKERNDFLFEMVLVRIKLLTRYKSPGALSSIDWDQ